MTRRAVTERIADFLTGFACHRPDDTTMTTVARAFLDTVAVAVAAREEPAARIVKEYLADRHAARTASVWGSDLQLAPEDVALVNAVQAHVLDYDDVTPPMRGHPSVTLLPPLVALAETADASCTELTAAYAAGFEVLCKLAKAGVHEQYVRGWFSTSALGVIAGTAACAHLLRLDRTQTVNSLGIAAGHASGVQENFGTMSKSLQVGNAAAVAVRATKLAALGYTATPHGIDGAAGYLALYFPDFDLPDEVTDFGAAPLEIHASSLGVKQYPNCFSVHRPIDATVQLLRRHSVEPADIAAVDVTTNASGLRPLIESPPTNSLDAKFSMEYGVAVAVTDGVVTLSSFAPENLRREDLRELMDRVQAREATGPPLPRWARVRITLHDGAVLEHEQRDLHGGPDDPLTVAELQHKIDQCFAFASAAVHAPDAAAALRSWPDLSVRDAVRQSAALP